MRAAYLILVGHLDPFEDCASDYSFFSVRHDDDLCLLLGAHHLHESTYLYLCRPFPSFCHVAEGQTVKPYLMEEFTNNDRKSELKRVKLEHGRVTLGVTYEPHGLFWDSLGL